MLSRIKNLLILLLIFFVGFLYKYNPKDNVGSTPDVRFNLRSDSTVSDRMRLKNQAYVRYIRMVFIGSTRCPISNEKKLIKSVKKIKNKVNNLYNGKNISVVTTGVSTNFNGGKGLSFLSKTGPYDEYISGFGSYNSGLMRFVWPNDKIDFSTPKVILFNEKYSIEHARKVGIKRIDLSDRKSIISLDGENEIISFAKRQIDDLGV